MEDSMNMNVEVNESDIKKAKRFRVIVILALVMIAIGISIAVYCRVQNIMKPKPAPDSATKIASKTVEIKSANSSKKVINTLQEANYVKSTPEDVMNGGYSNNYWDFDYVDPNTTVNAGNIVADIDEPTVSAVNENKIVDIYNNDNKKIQEPAVVNDVVCDEKPVIYVYNLDGERINISLDFPGQLSCTYPVINSNNSWDLTVYSNSTFEDSKGSYYPYLFYEGFMERNMFDTTIKEGACVKGSDTVAFLYDVLKQFGMSDIECSDFITYWAPRMIKNPYNLISFQNSRYSALVPIKTDPVIDTQIRIYMVWQASDVEVDLIPQTLDVVNRPEDGTVPYLLEWGGAELGSSSAYGVSTKQISEMSADEIQQEILSLSNMTAKANQRLSNLMAASSGIEAVGNNTSIGGHTFKDKNGRTTVFTTEEWQKLHQAWDYTGKFDEMINQFTVDELRNYLRLN